MNQIILGDGLDFIARLSPSRQSADDYERVESLFPQQVRHPGACAFA
jgi:hypothetical protein